LRAIDLAREHHLSTQAVRNYEELGVISPAERSRAGYRLYTPRHAQALRTFLALRAGYGHQAAIDLMRAANARSEEGLYTRLDELHAAFLQERKTIADIALAVEGIASAPVTHLLPGTAHSIGQVAHQVGVHPATLRQWERAGILRPQRDPATDYRSYLADDVRDAQITIHLRRAGAHLSQIAAFLDDLRSTHGTRQLQQPLQAWRHRLAQRSRHALHGQAQLHAYLNHSPDPDPDPESATNIRAPRARLA
jgi:DNA-binding transcriptional MerR regulator